MEPTGPAAISLATKNDRDALLALLRAQLSDHGIALGAERLARAVDGVLGDETRGRFLVARLTDESNRPARVVGVAYLSFTWCLEHGGRSAWLEELYVEPACRLRGIGRDLLRAACESAQLAGCSAVDLEVESSHARAANLYLRMGFRPHQRARWVKLM